MPGVRLADLAGARVVLLGVGRDVVAALPAVLDSGPASLAVVDDRHPPGSELALEGRTVEALSLAEALAEADVLVRSPGFPRYSPEVEAALQRGARCTTPLDLWLGSLAPERTVVAVTGTKGKSTTASMIAALAARNGVQVVVAGNIGTPVFEPGWDTGSEVVVLEVSSYQAADLHHAPDVAVITSLAEDHVDWHGSPERYRADKLRVLVNEGGSAETVFVASEDVGRAAGRALGGLQGEVRLVGVPRDEDPAVPGHVVGNAALAAAVANHLMGSDLSVADALAVAPRLQSRLEVIGRDAGITWIDDALGSNPSATASGLRWLRRQERAVVVLVGGAERGVDLAPLRDEVAMWPPGRLLAVTLPDNGGVLADEVGLEVVGSGSSVAEAAAGAARALAGRGGVVLFSPAAPTPKGHGTWRDRSAELRQAVGVPVSTSEGEEGR